MAENSRTVQLGEPSKNQSPQTRGMVSQFRELLKEPLVQELVIPYAKKEYLGIGKHEPNVIKGAGGRFLYGLRDLIQGTWWAFAGFSFALMLMFVLYLFLRKVLGV